MTTITPQEYAKMRNLTALAICKSIRKCRVKPECMAKLLPGVSKIQTHSRFYLLEMESPDVLMASDADKLALQMSTYHPGTILWLALKDTSDPKFEIAKLICNDMGYDCSLAEKYKIV